MTEDPAKYIKPIPMDRVNVVAFWSHVDRASGRFWDEAPDQSVAECFWWIGGRVGSKRLGQDKHGQFDIDGWPFLAHRVLWTIATGEDPGWLRVRHKCDHAPCQRIQHLELGTDKANSGDMLSRGRQRWEPVTGEEHWAHKQKVEGKTHHLSKLSMAQAREIRERYTAGGISQQVLASQYGVAQGVISQIILGRTYTEGEVGLHPRKEDRERTDRTGPWAKLSPDEVRLIRKLFNPKEGVTISALAEKFGVGLTAISNVVNGRTYRSVE